MLASTRIKHFFFVFITAESRASLSNLHPTATVALAAVYSKVVVHLYLIHSLLLLPLSSGVLYLFLVLLCST